MNKIEILALIFAAVFVCILLARIIFSFILNRAYRNYLSLKSKVTKLHPKSEKKLSKEDEELMRIKEKIPRAHSAVKAEAQLKGNQNDQTYEIMSSNEEENSLSEVNIVDIVKPIGLWTSMILGRKLTYLIQSAQIINKRKDKGFWASMVEAQERATGRERGRSM